MANHQTLDAKLTAMAKTPQLNPVSDLDRIRQSVMSLLDDATTIWELAQAAAEQQWESPPRMVDHAETGDIRRAVNVTSDPTGDAAVAPERIHYRKEFRQASMGLDHAASIVHSHVVRLDGARKRWRGF